MKKVIYKCEILICDEGTAYYLESILKDVIIKDTKRKDRTSFVIYDDIIKVINDKYQTLAQLLYYKMYKLDDYKTIIKKESYLYYYNFEITLKYNDGEKRKYFLFDMQI